MKRFWEKTRPGLNGCIEWTASCNDRGYGKIFFNGRLEFAHRVAWALKHGELPALCVLHRCDNRRCVNVEHLFLGTVQDNNRDMKMKGRAGFGGSHLQLSDIKFIRENSLRGRGRRSAPGQIPRAILAEWFGCSTANIGFILSGRSWSRVKGGKGCH